MLNGVVLQQVPGSDPDLRRALVDARLPTDDIEDENRIFFKAASDDGSSVGYSGIEQCDECLLLRSVVVDSRHRGQGYGRAIVEATLREAGGRDIYLATTTAAEFFSIIGFSEVPRDIVPPAVLATRQLSSICPSSATIMKFNRPPT